jgi:dolichol kinase
MDEILANNRKDIKWHNEVISNKKKRESLKMLREIYDMNIRLSEAAFLSSMRLLAREPPSEEDREKLIRVINNANKIVLIAIYQLKWLSTLQLSIGRKAWKVFKGGVKSMFSGLKNNKGPLCCVFFILVLLGGLALSVLFPPWGALMILLAVDASLTA